MALIQKTPNTTLPAEGNNVTTLGVTFNAQPTAGNFVALLFGAEQASALTFTVTDNRSNTYTTGSTLAFGGAGQVGVSYALNILTGSPFTVTITWSAATFFDIGAVEFSGVDKTGSPVKSSNSTATSASATTGTMSPTYDPLALYLYLGVFGTDNQNLTTITPTNGIQLWNEPSNVVEAAGMSYLETTGSQALTWTLDSSVTWGGAGAVFKETLPAPTIFASIPTSKKLAATVWQG